ncbi:MarR family transcriptional regulator [Fictibacillus aquaticus]|uniref:MarR family transcriptional regulator n=2 Tax=Fictibacillus aquaticus TaxID=2021314 RepID=A0A235F9R4_9BACL|nr:MarR family transcriptional regulator [Fictibacillus aquaticus]
MDIVRLQSVMQRFDTASFTVNKKFASLIREQIQDELTMDQLNMMRYIQNFSPCTTTELADAFCVNKSAITAIVTRMTEKNYIKRVRDRKDRRIVYLTLTAEGKKVFDWAEEKVFQIVGPYLQQFDEKEIETFLSLYEKLSSMLQKD